MKNELAENYLKSLEGLAPAELSPFFYTRLKGKLSTAEKNYVRISQLAIASLVLFLAMNFHFLKNISTDRDSAPATASEFAHGYNLSAGTNY